MTTFADVPAVLRSHPVFVGRDLDQAHAIVSEVVNPHTVTLRGAPVSLDVRFFASRVGAVTFAYLGWGTDVEITALDAATCFCIQLPMRGEATVSCGSQSIVSSRLRPSVPAPIEPLRMLWRSGSPQLILRIDQNAVEDQLRRLLDAPLRGPIRMPLGLDFGGAAGARWRAVFELVQTEIALRDDAERRDGKVTAASSPVVEELVTKALLLWHPNNYSDLLARDVAPARAPCVRKAMDYIHANLEAPLTVALLAETVGVSVRALQAGFARDIGCTPSSYIRDQRLDRIRTELQETDVYGGVTVTDVAMRWGMPHHGRMSRAYRARFGELPSETLGRPRVRRAAVRVSAA